MGTFESVRCLYWLTCFVSLAVAVTAPSHLEHKARGTCVNAAELKCLGDNLKIQIKGPSSFGIFGKNLIKLFLLS